MSYPELAETEFRRLYGGQPLVVRSPGRVNLIGEHTDYNLGFVLPAAIDKAISLAVAPRKDQQCRVCALDMNDTHEFSLGCLASSPKGWPNYVMGVVDQMLKAGYHIAGFDCAFGGDIPIGAGVSSSAALEAGLAFALNRLFDLRMDGLALAKLAQKAENEFVGVRCGIMDQYANLFGLKNHVLRIDCQSLEHMYYPFDATSASIVLLNTGVSHSLASSEYNRRRAECAEGVAIIQKEFPQVNSLRDATAAMIEDSAASMPDVIARRCAYVVEENERVLQACAHLQKKDLNAFGGLMYKSHAGLRDKYEVSCRELDYLVNAVSDQPGVLGARMMGGGFGGCTINLVDGAAVDSLCGRIAEQYERKFNIPLKSYVMSIGPGTSQVSAKDRMVS